MADEVATTLIRRADGMRTGRSNFDTVWQEVRDLLYASGDSFVSREAPGQKSHQKVFDNTGEQASELLAAVLHSMLANPASPWFGMRARDPRLNQDEEGARWLEQASRRMFDVFNSPHSNFAPQMHELWLELVDYGSGGMFVGDRIGQMPLFSTRPLVELYLAENNEGRVDTVFRRFQLSARAAVQEWGEAAGAGTVKKAENTRTCDDMVDFLHAVYPRSDEQREGRRGNRSMPFASCWVNITEQASMKESGYHEMPYITPRWAKRAGEVYGRGPGHKALADVKMLQRAMQVQIKGVEKMIDPPLMVADDGVLSPVRMSSGGLNFYRAGTWQMDPIKPILTGGRPDLGEEFMKGVRQRIEAAFYNHLLTMSRDPRMTATQVIQIAEETLRILGPVLGRLQTEALGPLIERVFNIMFRAGAFDPLPASLRGAQIEIEYISPIAKAQRLSEVKGMAQTIELMTPLISARPQVLDIIDEDATFRRAAELNGWPKDTLRTPDVVKTIRDMRAKAQQQQVQQQSVVDLAGAAKDAAAAVPGARELLGLSSPTAGSA